MSGSHLTGKRTDESQAEPRYYWCFGTDGKYTVKDYSVVPLSGGTYKRFLLLKDARNYAKQQRGVAVIFAHVPMCPLYTSVEVAEYNRGKLVSDIIPINLRATDGRL